jgi:hypothetical protein
VKLLLLSLFSCGAKPVSDLQGELKRINYR